MLGSLYCGEPSILSTSFTRHFYKPQPLSPLEKIRADMLPNLQERAVLQMESSLCKVTVCDARQRPRPGLR